MLQESKSSLLLSKSKFDKFITEDDKVLAIESQIKNEQQIQITNNKIFSKDQSQIDDELDRKLLDFFKNFIRKNEDSPIKDKVQKILDLITSTKINNKKINMSNKMKNEILRNLKNEFLDQLGGSSKEAENYRKYTSSSPNHYAAENPFNNNLINKENKHKKNDLKANLKNKVIITKEGWGVTDVKKEKRNGTGTQTPAGEKKVVNKSKELNNNKKSNGTKNQNSKANNSKDHTKNNTSEWIGNSKFDSSDDSGEWVVKKK